MRIKRNILTIGALIIYSLFSCEKDKDPISPDSVITEIDVVKMAKNHLTNYQLARKQAIWNYGREFVFIKNYDSTNIFIIDGIHQSDQNAYSVVINYLNSCSALFNKGVHQVE